MALMWQYYQLGDTALTCHCSIHSLALHGVCTGVVIVVPVQQEQGSLSVCQLFGVGEGGQLVVDVGYLPIVSFLRLEAFMCQERRE